MQQIGTLGLSGGINTDMDKAFYDGNTYLQATNFTATPTGGNTLGALENVRGNELVSDIVFAAGHEMIGYANIVRDVVYFTTDGTDSNIYLYSNNTLSLKYSDTASTSKLNFSLDPKYRIVAVGRQETDTISKVYWADSLNEFRYIDLSKDYTGKEATAFDAVPINNSLVNIQTILRSGGNYKTGVIRYSYQLYNVNGTSSTFSTLSFPVKLSEYSGQSEGGNEKDENTNKAVSLKIGTIENPLSSDFNRIRVVALYVSEDSSLPKINIVGEYELTGGIFTCLDIGNVVGELTYEEFLTFKQVTYSAKAIESKNNILFLGNVKEKSFTSSVLDDFNNTNYWDARAYRFDDSGNYSKVFTSDGIYTMRIYGSNEATPFKVHVVTDNNNPDFGEDFTLQGERVPLQFDCVNYYNSIYNSSLFFRAGDLSGGYRHVGNGASIGGEGENVKYEFVEAESIIDTDSLNPGSAKLNKDNEYTASLFEDNVIECQSGEVYRVGIRFINNKGQSSFVKWIGDVLWEELLDSSKVQMSVVEGNVTKNKIKMLKVTLKSLPQDDSIAGWQVVRARRTKADKSVKASGILQTMAIRGSEDFHRPFCEYTGTTEVQHSDPTKVTPFLPISRYSIFLDAEYSSINKKLFKFISPDLIFNNNGTIEGGIDKYKVRMYNFINSKVNRGKIYGTEKHFLTDSKYNSLIGASEVNTLKNLNSIVDYAYSAPQHSQNGKKESFKNIDTERILNQTHLPNFFNGTLKSGACSSLFIKVDNDMEVDDEALLNPYYIMYASLIQDVDTTRYGGNSYSAIRNTEYVPFSKIYKIEGSPLLNQSIECIYGDMYTTPFSFINQLFWDDVDNSLESVQERITFPVETSLDLRYRLDRINEFGIFSTDYINQYKSMMLQEKVVEGIEYQGTLYDTAVGDLYRYNPVYSNTDFGEVYYSYPLDFSNAVDLNTKIIASEKKSNGENEDNWTTFLTNNFIEVDTAYGGVNDLKTKDTELYFWQDKAFGKLAVNDRSLITDSSGAQLALGTGGVLERYDYISNEVGNVDKYSISTSEDAIYWMYSPKNCIYMYNGQLQELSTSQGVSNFLKLNPTTNPISVSDFKSNETLFKVGTRILVYDWMTKKFTGDYTSYDELTETYYYPNWFIPEFDGNVISSSDSETIYRHNSDNVRRGQFYGVDNNSSIKHIFVKDFSSTKVFDVLNWHSTSLLDGVNQYEDTFSNYRIYNDYQNTDWQPISWKRKERTFNTVIPKDRVNTSELVSNVDIFDNDNLQPGQSFARRIRDKYIILDLEYENKDNITFSVPYINVGYRSSIR